MTEQLQEMKARLEAATPGPWQVGGMDSGHSLYEMDWWVTAGEGDTICDMDGLARRGNDVLAKDDGGADADFIAHSPETQAKLIAALEAVLGRHERGNIHFQAICLCCDTAYPCATVRLIAEALA